MRTRMRRAGIFLAACFAITLMSCTANYGKKVTFDGTKGEVYYKGDSVTEADAKAVGDYLKEQQFFQQDDKVRSVQISRSKGRVQVRFVIDEKAIAEMPDIDKSFAILGAGLSRNIFHDAPLDVIYTDNAFKDKKTIPFQPELLVQANPVGDELKSLKRIDDANNTLYYSSNIGEADAQHLVEYLKDKKFFIPEGNNDLIVKQLTGDSVWIRFPVKNAFANEAAYKMIDDFVKELKKDVFSTSALQFDITDTDLRAYKSLNY